MGAAFWRDASLMACFFALLAGCGLLLGSGDGRAAGPPASADAATDSRPADAQTADAVIGGDDAGMSIDDAGVSIDDDAGMSIEDAGGADGGGGGGGGGGGLRCQEDCDGDGLLEDLQTDPANCGRCGNRCSRTTVYCCAGMCISSPECPGLLC